MRFYSQIRTYNDTADSTLPNVPKKRKFEDEEEDTPHKTPRIEPVIKSEPEIGTYFLNDHKFSDSLIKIYSVCDPASC